MTRRLFNRGRQQEREEQDRLQARVMRSFERSIRQDIASVMQSMVDGFERTGNVRPDDEHARRVRDALRSDYLATIEVFGERIIDAAGKRAVGPRDAKASGEDLYQRILQDFIAVRGLDKISSDIAGTTLEQVRRAVARGREDGLGSQQIADKVRGDVPQLSRARAGMIARTETHSAANYAQDQAAKELGLPLRKEWIAAPAEGEFRPEHQAADGETVGMDAAFTVMGEELQYPGDPSGSAINTINCRCATGHVVDD